MSTVSIRTLQDAYTGVPPVPDGWVPKNTGPEDADTPQHINPYNRFALEDWEARIINGFWSRLAATVYPGEYAEEVDRLSPDGNRADFYLVAPKPYALLPRPFHGVARFALEAATHARASLDERSEYSEHPRRMNLADVVSGVASAVRVRQAAKSMDPWR